jgi:hypothetical protein
MDLPLSYNMVFVLLVYVVSFKYSNETRGLFEEHQTVRVSHFDPKFKFESSISPS